LGDRRPPGEALPRRARERPRDREADQRSHLAHRRGVLLRAVGGHAQPHEGSAGAARQASARDGAAAAGEDFAGGDRAHPQGGRRRGPARSIGPLAARRLMKIECLLTCDNHLGEGPVWDVEEGRLYWVDGTGRRVNKPSIWRYDPKSGKTESWSLKHDV